MSSNNRKVILCKGQSDSCETEEAYVKLLKSAGYKCECLRTLRFEFVNLSELRESLLTPESFTGLVLTSRRAVEAISLAVKEPSDLQPWKTLPAYCVGPATESFAKNSLRLEHCLGNQCGNAKELAQKIVVELRGATKPLLYPCSEIARDTIEQILNTQHLEAQKLIVYRTLPSKTLEQDLSKLVDNDVSIIFVFFSPSTVEYLTPLLNQQKNDRSPAKFVAIGPVTEQALINAGYNVYAVAGKPEPMALLQAILEAEGRIVNG